MKLSLTNNQHVQCHKTKMLQMLKPNTTAFLSRIITAMHNIFGSHKM